MYYSERLLVVAAPLLRLLNMVSVQASLCPLFGPISCDVAFSMVLAIFIRTFVSATKSYCWPAYLTQSTVQVYVHSTWR
jgi:hypothetical protein